MSVIRALLFLTNATFQHRKHPQAGRVWPFADCYMGLIDISLDASQSVDNEIREGSLTWEEDVF